jgi:Flavin reductase like domain
MTPLALALPESDFVAAMRAGWFAGATGAPLLAGGAARFDCVVASMVEAGSHTVVFGDVLAAAAGSVPPLAYTGGDYAWIRATPGNSAATRVPPVRPGRHVRAVSLDKGWMAFRTDPHIR